MPETTFAVSHSDFTKIWFVPTFDLRLWGTSDRTESV